MKIYTFFIIAFTLFITNTNAMDLNKNPFNEDTLTLKGRVVKADMETQKGTKSEGVQDYYFSTGSNSYFIKTAVGKFSKQDLDKIGDKEIIIKCTKKFGTVDIGPDDPSYAATRVGEYIVILEIIK